MSSQSLLMSSLCMQHGQRLLDFAPLSAPFGPKPALLPTPRCLSSLGSVDRFLPGSLSGAQKFGSSVLRPRRSPHGRVRYGLTICRTGPMDESQQLGDGPIEPRRPGFSRLPHSSLSFIPADDPAAAPLPPKKIKINTRRGGRQRRWKKATPAQVLSVLQIYVRDKSSVGAPDEVFVCILCVKAMTGAIFAGLWAALALKGTVLAYEHLDSHPLAHDLPMGMANNVNQILMTAVTGFGAFAVLIFSVCSFGLALLTLKLISAPKTPPQ